MPPVLDSMAETTIAEHRLLKEEGNEYFKQGKYENALVCYTEALKVSNKVGSDCNDSELAVYYKNRAATHLKLENYEKAITDSGKALDITPNDPKALFRRCQAYEQLGKHEDAYKDAVCIMKVDPKNRAVQPILKRLNPIIQTKVADQHSTNSKVTQMFDLVFGANNEDMEKRKQAASNLIVLARDDAGAHKIFTDGGVPKLLQLLECKDMELRLSAIRVLACLAKDSKTRAAFIINAITIRRLGFLISENDDNMSTAASHLVQTVIMAVTDIEKYRNERDKHENERRNNITFKAPPYPNICQKIAPDGMEIVDTIFTGLTWSLNQAKCSHFGRDNVMELIIKFIARKNGVGWSLKFIAEGGVFKLLEVAGTIAEHKTIPVSSNSRMHASLALSKIYDDLLSDQERDQYRDSVDEYFKDMFGDTLMESKLEAITAMAALLQGPFEVGNAIIAKEGVMEVLLAMANSGDAIHTKYAVEALVHSASKKDRCSGVIKQATPILKELYQSANDYIKVRALVGLCKLGSFGGADASAKSMADGSTETLSKACRKFLKNPAKDIDLRKWAAEGLAYLSLDADVKEQLVEDTQSLSSLIELAKVPDKGVLYPMASILVNITNSFDKKDVDPELLELAKFAKHHIPEDHEKDQKEFVDDRINKIVAAGVVPALVALTQTDSENCKELLSRVFTAICTIPEHRGLVIQQGGAKVLIPLALDNTDKGKLKAAQALAKIAITNDPKIAFPGQRAYEVIRPIVQLLSIDRTALENYEALLALTNLAGASDSIRRRIFKEQGFAKIEHYCYEEHDDLRRAAVECVCNLVVAEEAAVAFEGDNDRVKLMVLFSGEEDEGLVQAASGALAILSARKTICQKIISCTEQWFDILRGLLEHDTPGIQHRGVHIIHNLVDSDKDIAKRIIESPMLELLMALTIMEDPARTAAKDAAAETLERAVEHGLIKPNKMAGAK